MKFRLIPRAKIKVEGYRLRFKSGVEDIESLVKSIKENGIICPLAVSQEGDMYSLIAGERRLLALDKLKWEEIPCVILNEEGDGDALIKGIVENSERLDLSPWERAKAFKEIIESYGCSQGELAQKIGRQQPYISLHLRLIDQAHPQVLKYLHEGRISFGHAEALLKLGDQAEQSRIVEKTVKEGLTVRDVRLMTDQARPQAELTDQEKELNEIERDIIKHFGKDWRIWLKRFRKNVSKKYISFSSNEL